MTRSKQVFITGSTDGLGFMTANNLLAQGDRVIFHARSEQRRIELEERLGSSCDCVIGDFESIDQIKSVGEQVVQYGQFDAIIHNAGIANVTTPNYNPQHLTSTFTVNVVAPFILSLQIPVPERLIYLSSDMHYQGVFRQDDWQWEHRSWESLQCYADSKLYVTMLMRYFSQLYKDSYVNAVDPGWVPTKMGGAMAPDNLEQGAITQGWLATSDDQECLVTGKFFRHQREREPNQEIFNHAKVLNLIEYLQSLKL